MAIQSTTTGRNNSYELLIEDSSSRAPSKERRVTLKAAATVRNENGDDDLVRVEEVVDVPDKIGGVWEPSQ